MTDSDKKDEERKLTSDIKELDKKLTLDVDFSRECYSALTRSQWRLKTNRSVSCDFTYRDAASLIAHVRNEHRGLNGQMLEKEEAEKRGIKVEERKAVTDTESRLAGVDVVYKDELLCEQDGVCVCKCNHTKESHDKEGLCHVKVKSVENGEEKLTQCHCSIYLGPEDYKDVIYCAPQGVITKRVLRALGTIGWEPAPPGTVISTLRGVLLFDKGLSAIKTFAEKEYSSENILFLEAIHTFKQWNPRASDLSKKCTEANEIIKKFIDEGGQTQVNLPGWTVRKVQAEMKQITELSSSAPKTPKQKNYKIAVNAEQEKVLKSLDWQLVRLTPNPQPLEDRLYHVFDEAEDEIFYLVQKDTFPRFSRGELYETLQKLSPPGKKGGCQIL